MGGKVGNCRSLSMLQILPVVTKGRKQVITGWAQLFAVYNSSTLVEAWKGRASWRSTWQDISKTVRGSGARQRETPSENTKVPGRRSRMPDLARRG